MIQANVAELLIHLSTFLVVLIPAFLLWRFCGRANGPIKKAFTLLFLGVTPVAVYHLLESLFFFDIYLLPPEGTMTHIIIDHSVTALAILSFAIFILWFDRQYINPIFSVVEAKRQKK